LAACALAGGLFFFPGVSIGWSLLALIAGLAGLAGLSHLLFAGGRIWLEIIPAALVFFGQFTAGTALQKVYERRKNAVVTGLFGKYVSPAVATEILQKDLEASLAGQRRVVSILFSDLRDFTAISEKLGARRTGALLNAYFGAMLPLVFRHQGTLDKLIGDAVMAFFGAPVPVPDHPVKAAQTALAMTDALDLLKQGPTPDAQALQVGIGINTGEVTVGNLGSEAFMDYTIIGDAVNLASRLEGLNKIYGTRILLSESSAQTLDRQFVLRQIDRVRVKGRSGAVTIFELVGASDGVAAERISVLDDFSAGLSAYRERAWDRAAGLFQRVLEKIPTDGPSKLYLERIAKLRTSPPPPEWDGVSVYTEK
jgi:adenylate cyclase